MLVFDNQPINTATIRNPKSRSWLLVTCHLSLVPGIVNSQFDSLINEFFFVFKFTTNN